MAEKWLKVDSGKKGPKVDWWLEMVGQFTWAQKANLSGAQQGHSAAKHHVIAPQLSGKPGVGSPRKTHLCDLDKKLIKRFFDSYCS